MSPPNVPADAKARRSRAQVWLLIGMFFAPLAVAFLLYYGLGGSSWRPHGSTNKGDLIHPVRPLPQVTLQKPTGEPLEIRSLQDKWTLVYAGDGQCDTRCREALVLSRQTRLALNQNMTRVQRLFLVSANCCDEEYLHTEHPDLIIALTDDDAGRQLMSVFPEGSAANTEGRIYIVDPLGNLMMSYSPQAPREALLEDLKKLLKLSHIG
jgi:cytochrome oxidase Cu insertion factor (SCO1/SenC/PrrC family)